MTASYAQILLGQNQSHGSKKKNDIDFIEYADLHYGEYHWPNYLGRSNFRWMFEVNMKKKYSFH